MTLPIDNAARPSDAPPPEAFSIDYEAGSFPTEFTNPDQFSHEDGDPWEAPRNLVVFVTWTDEFGNRREEKDANFIVYQRMAGPNLTQGVFTGGEQGGITERLIRGESIVVFNGRWVATSEFNRIARDARADARFPEHTGDEPEIRSMLEAAAGETGENAWQIQMQANFTARRAGYPQITYIDPILKNALRASNKA